MSVVIRPRRAVAVVLLLVLLAALAACSSSPHDIRNDDIVTDSDSTDVSDFTEPPVDANATQKQFCTDTRALEAALQSPVVAAGGSPVFAAASQAWTVANLFGAMATEAPADLAALAQTVADAQAKVAVALKSIGFSPDTPTAVSDEKLQAAAASYQDVLTQIQSQQDQELQGAAKLCG